MYSTENIQKSLIKACDWVLEQNYLIKNLVLAAGPKTFHWDCCPLTAAALYVNQKSEIVYYEQGSRLLKFTDTELKAFLDGFDLNDKTYFNVMNDREKEIWSIGNTLRNLYLNFDCIFYPTFGPIWEQWDYISDKFHSTSLEYGSDSINCSYKRNHKFFTKYC